MSRPRQDQFEGGLIGCAVGDALGAPLEGWSRERIAELPNVADGYRRLSRGKDPSSMVRYPIGQYTDDTQLTMAIARSLVARECVDGADIAREFAALWRSREIVGAGPVADRAVRRLIEGIDWQEAALQDDLPWNGAAMRIAPVGLWDCDRKDRLVDDVEVASVVTHRHPLAIDAALAVATAVVHVVSASTIDEAHFLDQVARSVETRSPQFAGQVQQLGSWLRLGEDDALAAIVGSSERRRASGFGVPALAVPTVLAAFFAFLRSPDNFVASVDCALRVGGDVDTVAAIAGAISGAHNGVDAIPGNLVAGVKDSAEILDLGRRLFALRFGG